MTERETVLTDGLLTALARYLGQEVDEPVPQARLAQHSPAMLAAWAQATNRRRRNER